MESGLRISEELLISKIYLLRGRKVMLDRDLAELYEVKAFRLREQVKRNMEKFPSHFMFHLTEQEVDFMVSQNAIPSKQHLGGHLPFVFTEHGLLQLANVLKSGKATLMSIKIIEIFIKMRELLLSHKELALEMEKIKRTISGQDEKIKLLFSYIKQILIQKKKPVVPIGFKQSVKNKTK